MRIAKLTTTTRFALIGGAFILAGGILSLLGLPSALDIAGGYLKVISLGGMSYYSGIVGVISGAALLLASLAIDMRSLNRIQTMAIIILTFSITSLIDGGGFLIGFALSFAGALDAGFAYYLVARGALRGTQRQGTTTKQASTVVVRPAIPKAPASLGADERKLFDLVAQAGGSIFQAELVEKSGFSKVKVSRVLDRLEGQGLAERRRRGMTNMILLKNVQ